MFEAVKTANGYHIRTTDARGRFLYLKSIYRGRAVYVTDYTHAKTYKTEASAYHAIMNALK